MQSEPTANLILKGIPASKLQTLKIILESLNVGLKLGVKEIVSADVKENLSINSVSIVNQDRIRRFNQIAGKIALDKIPTDEDKKQARSRIHE